MFELRKILGYLKPQRESSPTTRVLAALSRSRKHVTFIQIGSNDADYGDPLRPFIISHAWHGTMVEPVPYVFARLKLKYGAIPNIHLLNCAIAEESGSKDFYHLVESNDVLPKWYDQIGSFYLETVLKHRKYIPDIDSRVRKLSVACITVSQLLEQESRGALDLVHSDVEGFDHHIVKSLLRTASRPAVFIYEHLHLTSEMKESCRVDLQANGYVAVEEGANTICVQADQMLLVRAMS